jgi:hypothetical protein
MVAEHLGLPSDMSYGPRDAGAALTHSLPALPVSAGSCTSQTLAFSCITCRNLCVGWCNACSKFNGEDRHLLYQGCCISSRLQYSLIIKLSLKPRANGTQMGDLNNA